MTMSDLDKAFAAAIVLIANRDAAVGQANDIARNNTRMNNRNRHAVAEMTYLSTGTGQVRFAQPLDFPVRFRTEPQFATGSGVRSNPHAKLWHDPRGSGGVRAWVRDKNGLYTGAYVWLRVDMDPITPGSDLLLPPQDCQVVHYLTFMGIAVKDLPADGIENVKPRKVDR